MKNFEDFQPSGDSFEDRERPSSLLSALGRLALAYAELQQRVEATIDALGHDPDSDHQPASRGLPFKKQLDYLGDLIAAEEQRVRFNAGHLNASELRLELIQLLRCASKLCQETVNPHLLGVHLRCEAGPELAAKAKSRRSSIL